VIEDLGLGGGLVLQNPGPALPRLFISHSSKDNVVALAFRRWLAANGWAESEVFIDLHGIGAGVRWRETLRKANVACEGVILLASPNSLASVECEKELELAEALGKPIIPAIIRDLTVKHPRLAPWADRQIVDLSQQPTEPIEPFEYEGKLHRVGFSVAALASIKPDSPTSASRPAVSRGSRASGPTGHWRHASGVFANCSCSMHRRMRRVPRRTARREQALDGISRRRDHRAGCGLFTAEQRGSGTLARPPRYVTRSMETRHVQHKISHVLHCSRPPYGHRACISADSTGVATSTVPRAASSTVPRAASSRGGSTRCRSRDGAN
jgi:hypothetical protein